MAERSTNRAPSVSSSEAETSDENEKSSTLGSSTDEPFTKPTFPEDLETGDDVERAGLLSAEQEDQEKAQPPAQEASTRTAFIWMVVNTLATIGIVGDMASEVRS